MLQPKLKTKVGVPYGGLFDVNMPERGVVGRATNFWQFKEKVEAYRKANGLPIGLGFDDELEKVLCFKYPNECVDCDPRIPPSNVNLTLDDIMRGTRIMAKFKVSGSPLVSKEEADRRAKICASCSFNSSFAKPCSGICQELKNIVIGLVGSSSTKYDNRLQACRICHCFNQASVWLPLDIQQSYLSDQQKERFRYATETVGCWKGIGL